MAWDLCIRRTSAAANGPAASVSRNYHKQKLLSHPRIVSTGRSPDCQILFTENLFYLAHFFLDRPAYFLRGAAILHVRIARRLACLFFHRALGLLHAPFDLILRARLHTKESALARRWDGRP
jgi:hypothetical protein